MRGGLRVHDRPGDPMASQIVNTVAEMRRQKDPDEIDALKSCMRATDAGHAWAHAHVKAGMSELDVYSGVSGACVKTAGHAGRRLRRFRGLPRLEAARRPANAQVLKDGDMMILDFSVVIGGYRSDFTNTLVVGGKPNTDQKRLYDLCVAAMTAGEKYLHAERPA